MGQRLVRIFHEQHQMQEEKSALQVPEVGAGGGLEEIEEEVVVTEGHQNIEVIPRIHVNSVIADNSKVAY